MVVTVGTNVLFQVFYSNRGASHQIFRLIRNGELTMAISVPVFQEYRAALSREENLSKLNLTVDDINEILLFIATVAFPVDISYLWRSNLRDESDNMILELAIASRSEYLVTSNIRDFTVNADLKNDDIHVVTPGDFLRNWRALYEK